MLNRGLTNEAQKILKAAVAGGGQVGFVRSLGGPNILVSRKGGGLHGIIPDGSGVRDVAEWVSGFEELWIRGYVRDMGSGQLFEVTSKGYTIADQLVSE